MRRTRMYIVIGFAVFVFLGISVLLARALSATGAERDLVLQLTRAEARGDVNGVLARTPQCAADAAWAAATPGLLPPLKGRRDRQILRYDVSRQLPTARQIGTGRGPWPARTSL